MYYMYDILSIYIITFSQMLMNIVDVTNVEYLRILNNILCSSCWKPNKVK